MKVWNVYDDEIREIVEEVGLAIWNDRPHRWDWTDEEGWRRIPIAPSGIKRVGRAYQFRLKVGRKVNGVRPFQKLSYGGKKTAFVCWHGHREFLYALFRRFPDARVRSDVMTYNGRQDFLDRYRDTRQARGWNYSMAGACTCEVPDAQGAPRRHDPNQPPRFVGALSEHGSVEIRLHEGTLA